MRKKLVVLHATESFGGGVSTALSSYINSTPDLEHHLLFVSRGGTLDRGLLGGLNTVHEIARSGFRKALKHRIISLNPDVVHLHSSWAGVYGRFPTRVTRAKRLVYSPHGLAFERRDVHGVLRRIFWFVEGLLSRNTDVIVCCSEREKRIAPVWATRTQKVYVPNVASIKPSELPQQANSHFRPEVPIVAAVGRITPAKDPNFFSRLSKLSEGADFQPRWIGGSSEVEEERLSKDANAEVTGWLGSGEVIEQMRKIDIYVHTAAWEGFPMTVLEACALRKPIIARRIPVFDSAEIQPYLVDTPDQMFECVLKLVGNTEAQRQCVYAWSKFTEVNTPSVQSKQLYKAYYQD